MSKSSTMALAIGAGYMLGRKRKLRMAVMVAGAAAAGTAGGLAGRAMRTGGKLLTSAEVLDKLPPEAAKIVSLISSDLAEAGKAAAKAAVTNRVEGLTSALNDRASAVRGDGHASEPADDEEPEAQDEADEEAGEEADEERPRPPRQRESRERTSSRNRPAKTRAASGSGRRSGR